MPRVVLNLMSPERAPPGLCAVVPVTIPTEPVPVKLALKDVTIPLNVILLANKSLVVTIPVAILPGLPTCIGSLVIVVPIPTDL